MKINSLIENKDGSATMNIDLSVEEVTIFLELGIITAIRNGIDHSKDTQASSSNIKGSWEE